MEPQARRAVGKTQKATGLTAAEAGAIAQEAYVFGLPLVYIAVSIDAADKRCQARLAFVRQSTSLGTFANFRTRRTIPSLE